MGGSASTFIGDRDAEDGHVLGLASRVGALKSSIFTSILQTQVDSTFTATKSGDMRGSHLKSKIIPKSSSM